MMGWEFAGNLKHIGRLLGIMVLWDRVDESDEAADMEKDCSSRTDNNMRSARWCCRIVVQGGRSQ